MKQAIACTVPACLLLFSFFFFFSLAQLDTGISPPPNRTIAALITEDIFDQFAYNLQSVGCEGNGFYTYHAFLDAAPSFSAFGTTGDLATSKQELAAFFAHVAEQTSGLCNVSQIVPTHRYCIPRGWPCASGISYHGRGPLQLSWNYNYGPAGESIGFDGINNPEAVATDAIISFKSAIWFWMTSHSTRGSCHDAMVANRSFSQTSAIIKGEAECPKGSLGEASSRYQQYCQILSVDPGSSLVC